MSLQIKAVAVAAFASLIAVGCASTDDDSGAVEQTASNAGRAVDDSVITGKVKAALVADPTTKAHQINVETFKGTVQLSGFVDTSEARSRATEVAKNVDGVQSVKNELAIRDKS
jgi:osmotically-inducible protein OsmY